MPFCWFKTFKRLSVLHLQQSATRESSDAKQFNPMKGKAREVSVPRKELFVEAEVLIGRPGSLMASLSTEELEKDIIHPRKTPEITVQFTTLAIFEHVSKNL